MPQTEASENQKLKLLYLVRIFTTETDQSHGLSIAELIERLAEEGISAERKALYRDIEALRRFGYDIAVLKHGGTTRYSMVSREFELPELRLLVDAVQSSRFITEKKSRSLIRKLESLVSSYDAGQLQRQVLVSGRIKNMDESIYYIVDKLHAAINEDSRIRFKYFQWGTDKKEAFRHDGAWYRVSPWYLLWADENYYLIAYDPQAGKLKHYRVDKMRLVQATGGPREGKELMKNFDAAAYSRQLFGMYGGETVRVSLECENRMIGILIDRFGKDIPVIKLDEEHFSTTVEVAVSPQFLGWLASLGAGIRVTAPEPVVDDMRQLIRSLAEKYNISGK